MPPRDLCRPISVATALSPFRNILLAMSTKRACGPSLFCRRGEPKAPRNYAGTVQCSSMCQGPPAHCQNSTRNCHHRPHSSMAPLQGCRECQQHPKWRRYLSCRPKIHMSFDHHIAAMNAVSDHSNRASQPRNTTVTPTRARLQAAVAKDRRTTSMPATNHCRQR